MLIFLKVPSNLANLIVQCSFLYTQTCYLCFLDIELDVFLTCFLNLIFDEDFSKSASNSTSVLFTVAYDFIFCLYNN